MLLFCDSNSWFHFLNSEDPERHPRLKWSKTGASLGLVLISGGWNTPGTSHSKTDRPPGEKDLCYQNPLILVSFLNYFVLAVLGVKLRPLSMLRSTLPLSSTSGPLFSFRSWDRVSLCCPFWPWTHFVAQVGLNLGLSCLSLPSTDSFTVLLLYDYIFWYCIHLNNVSY